MLDEGARDDPGHAVSRNRRWLAVLRAGLALEAGDLELAAEYTEDAKPATARSLVGVLGLDVHLAARQRRSAGGPRRPRGAARRDPPRGLGLAVAGARHHRRPGWLPASTADELRPLVAEVGIFPGHRLDDDHPWRQLLDAQLAEADGDVEVAANLYAAAAEPHRSSRRACRPGTEAPPTCGPARCLIALGALDEARSHAAAAADHLARWRGWRVDELVAVQRRLGIGPGASGPDALTAREREVAALVAESLSNAALAERLYISPRTAAVHVSNILAKLGMSSRTEIATWAVREGLGETTS